MTLELVSEARLFDGLQRTYRHHSTATGTPMRVAAYLPPQAEHGPVPVLWFLAGLTCTETNFIEKAGAQRVAAELGLALLAPDTSPRGDGVPDDPAWDFGQGAGFYLDATQAPWATNFRMRSYIEDELPGLVFDALPLDRDRQAISGHSMGGHGALTVALRNPGRFRSVSALAPIVSPLHCPWGEKALGGYLGADRTAWRRYDACALIADGARVPEILVDQGLADNFLERELKPHLLEAACRDAGIALTLHLRPGYDHSYFFIASVIESHLRWHAARLGAGQRPGPEKG
ncbi:S-formylglutathione hydrolase [Lichenihabitans sp. Uapishka_5]|uniref:S-formylglutathione hydrolase n=1 Tax=Lichenihabitans sp. Uapishka_5 TaxID=3037302 RepID=UPI0029E808DD|nr:S-formylglutathione hydrolase [Lichenihabitans sp. Uapishka_5]MDX7953141.1 S-formylglutathione hydrolase [Lichenihabitans sp. Uapishka_5]